MNGRGVIIVPEFSIKPGVFEVMNCGPVQFTQMVRRALPNWDRFDLPVGAYHFGVTEDLESLGIVEYTEGPYDGADPGEAFIAGQIHAYKTHEASDPGSWSIYQAGDAVWLPPTKTLATRAIEATLFQALPVPGDDVSFDDILNFKQFRNAELVALRAGIDELYLDIASSADIPRSTTAAIARIERALADLDSVTQESWSSRFISTLKVEITSASIVAACAGLSSPSAWSIASALTAFASTGFLKMDWNLGARVARLPDQTAAFTYAHKVGNQIS